MRKGEQGGDLLGVGDVDPQEHTTQFRGQIRTAGLVEIADHHGAALRGEPTCAGQPDPRTAARDHHDPVRESSTHACPYPLLVKISREDQPEEKKTFFSSVNACTASGPSSRPTPDCL